MNFVFVDETGDTGSKGGTDFFGYTILQVSSNDYHILHLLISQVCWLCGSAKPMRLTERPYRILNLLRGLKELANDEIISASALYIRKDEYCGRYLHWADYEIPPTQWTHYLRNYLLRHALEFHFTTGNNLITPIEIILDRFVITEDWQSKSLRYFNSQTPIPLRENFKIPPVLYLTLADSHYVHGIQVAHVLADTLRWQILGNINPTLTELSSFMRIKYFVGEGKTS